MAHAKKPSPDTGKVAALAVGRGKYEQTHKRVSYRTVLNTCPSFLNGMKKSGREYRYEKVRERVKNPGRGCSYQMCFPVPAAGFFANTQYSAVPFYSFAYFHRSRMTAGVLLVFYDILTCVGQLTSIAPQSRMFSCHNKLLTVGILDSLTKRRCFFKI